MLLKYKIILLITLFVKFTNAQFMHEEKRVTYIYGSLGPSVFRGDAGNKQTADFANYLPNNNNFFFGAGINTIYKHRFGLELGINAGKLSATDANIPFTNTTDPNYILRNRNLDFNTNIFEAQTRFTFYPLQFFSPRTKIYKFRLKPFIAGGIGLFTFNPRGSYYDPIYKTNIEVELKPLSTEGQGFAEYPDRKSYKLAQLNIPFGGGLYYQLNEYMFISIGIQARKIFTDYLDDVSTTYIDTTLFTKYLKEEELINLATIMHNKTVLLEPFDSKAAATPRGNDKKFDSYLSYNLTLGFKIGRKQSKKPTYIKFDSVEICD